MPPITSPRYPAPGILLSLSGVVMCTALSRRLSRRSGREHRHVMFGSNTREGGSAVKRPQGFGLPPQETGNPRAKPGGHKRGGPRPQDTADPPHQDDALLTGRKGSRAARGIRFAVASTKPERETESDSEVVDSSPDGRRERRALLALERERRQYERQEIRRLPTFQRRRRRMWALGLGSVTVVVIAVWAIAYSPLFA